MEEEKQKAGKEAKILVVDDDPFILSLIKKQLKFHNFEVLTVDNGPEAKRIIEIDSSVDLIILDIMMPEIDGYQVARLIRDRYSLFEMPIIMLTAKNQVSDIVTGFEAGANDYIIKPFNNDELHSRTKTLVRLKKLTEENKNLQRAIELKNQFINMTIHDLKNPLGVVKGVTEILLDELKDQPEKIELLDLLKESAGLMMNLVYELLEAAKIESGKISLSKRKLDLNQAAEEVVVKNTQTANKKNQNILFSPDKEVDCDIYADPVRLLEILDNLISNAVKFSPKDKDIYVTVRHRIEDDGFIFLQFSVKDQGPGMTERDKQKAFQSFQKLSAQPTGGEPSSGLGLSIVKNLVELHDAKIWIESEHGKGAEFIVEFPACLQKQIPSGKNSKE